jgi:hypothetical protein
MLESPEQHKKEQHKKKKSSIEKKGKPSLHK